MTKSTGKQARQLRQEELFSAELKLRRAALHIRNGSWRDGAELKARAAAYDIVFDALEQILAEAEERCVEQK